jgi:hypothetical protein
VEWNSKKLADGPYRFPAFWGPGHDWVSDHNWGGSGMIGCRRCSCRRWATAWCSFAAWPRQWDVHFRLRRANGHTIEVKLQGGKVRVIAGEGGSDDERLG